MDNVHVQVTRVQWTQEEGSMVDSPRCPISRPAGAATDTHTLTVSDVQIGQL